MMSEIEAAAGDGGFGLTSELGNGGLWTATLRRRRLRLAFLHISSLLQIVSCDFPQICKIAIWKSFPFFCYLLKFLFKLLGVQNGSQVCIFCQGNLCFGECQFALLVQFFGSRVCFFASNGYNLEGRNGFFTVLLMNSDQLNLPKFS